MQAIQISVDEKSNLADVKRNICRLRGVFKCELIGPQTIRVDYNESMIVAKLIVKAVGRQPGMRRRNNVLKVHEILPTENLKQ